jgi:competence protein ComEA
LAPDRPVPAVFDDEFAEAGWGLTHGDRWFLAVAAAAVLLFSGLSLWRLAGWSLQPFRVERPVERRYEFQVEINSGTWVEWMQLDGVGETLARRIVADREAHGPFRSIGDVERVPGVGPATLAAMRGWLRCSDCPAATATEPASADRPPAAASSPVEPSSSPAAASDAPVEASLSPDEASSPKAALRSSPAAARPVDSAMNADSAPPDAANSEALP